MIDIIVKTYQYEYQYDSKLHPMETRNRTISMLTMVDGVHYTVFGFWYSKPLQLLLKEDSLVLTDDDQKDVYSVKLEDVLGLNVFDSPSPHSKLISPRCCQAEICTFRENKRNAKPKRIVEYAPLLFDTGESFNDNRETALQCQRALLQHCYRNDRKTFVGTEGLFT